MHLVLAHDSPGNTTISGPTGQVLYRSSTPFKWSERTTTVSKVVPNEFEDEHMRDRFAELAQIEWHGPKTSVFRYRGVQSLTKDFFQHEDKGGRWVYVVYADIDSAVSWFEGDGCLQHPTAALTCGSLTCMYHPWALSLLSAPRKPMSTFLA